MKMYRDYLRERLGDELIERDEGFATYRYIDFEGQPSVYIVDIYVRPDFRKSRVASEMADDIVRAAVKDGKKLLIGTVCSTAKNATDSIKVLLGYGMDFCKTTTDGLIFKKEI